MAPKKPTTERRLEGNSLQRSFADASIVKHVLLPGDWPSLNALRLGTNKINRQSSATEQTTSCSRHKARRRSLFWAPTERSPSSIIVCQSQIGRVYSDFLPRWVSIMCRATSTIAAPLCGALWWPDDRKCETTRSRKNGAKISLYRRWRSRFAGNQPSRQISNSGYLERRCLC